MKSPMERTLKWLRGQGYVAEVVERRVPHSFRTKDFCGFADILAFNPTLPADVDEHVAPLRALAARFGVLAVQATTAPDSEAQRGGHMAERVAKIKAEPRAKLWLECGNRILVIGWALKGGAGTRKLWMPTVQEIDVNGYTAAEEAQA